MTAVAEAELALCDAVGRRTGSLSIRVPPRLQGRGRVPPLVLNDDDHRELEQVQLLEGAEYRYTVDLGASGEVTLEPGEVTSPDDRSGRTGRLRPGLYTGRLVLRAFIDGSLAGEAAVEVRSRKLGYLDEYRWMLEDLARISTELALQRFAASEQRLALHEEQAASVLYQRFCFLKSLIASGRAESALAMITARPYVEWRAACEPRSSTRGGRGSSALARELAKPRPRVGWPGAWQPSLREIPATLPDERFEPSSDNIPNQFVRFVLEEWQARVRDLGSLLAEEGRRHAAASAPIRRGLREVADLQRQLERFLESPPLAGVGRLTRFPGSNQVLQRRAGYRELRELYTLSELAGVIDWDGGENVFGAGQRNVAALYEYWVFLQLATIIANLTGVKLDPGQLLKPRGDGLALGLKRGDTSTLTGTIERAGTIRLELSFNRSFRKTASGGSWTRNMQPDCSLMLRPEAEDPLIEPVSLHFDAKYRVGSIEEVLGTDTEEVGAHPEDLLKMHAYRDAILRAVGAYVIYPGDKDGSERKFSEIVPGLGAFSLTPGPDGLANGADRIQAFIAEVIDHLGARGTRRARATFWQTASYRGNASELVIEPLRWLRHPPADTAVLFGYVKDNAHLQWIRSARLYNLRADDRHGSVPLDSAALRAQILFLHGPPLGSAAETYLVGDRPTVLTAEELLSRGYPGPRGKVYFCLPITPEETPSGIDARFVQRLGKSLLSTWTTGEPFHCTFLHLLEQLRSP